jgi:endo-1,4-beta-D-glucanase Y
MTRSGSVLALLPVLACSPAAPPPPVAAPKPVASAPGVQPGARYPFPQSRKSPHCTYPANARLEDVRAAFAKWKQELVTANGAGGGLRVVRPDTPDGVPNSTVSEGIAYGMMIAVYLDDQALFDGLWKYEQRWVDETGLMKWYIDPTGTQACPGKPSCGAATDADEDIAWALVMADRQWGGAYLELARAQIDRVWKLGVDHDHGDILKPGNTWGGWDVLNLSYFAPYEYRVFGKVTGNEAGWQRVIDANYAVLERTLNAENGNAENGLVPAWSNGDGKPVVAFPGALTFYQTDSARTPFRIGMDYCLFGEPRAKAYLERVSAFFARAGADQIWDGYDLDGTPHPEVGKTPSRSAVFVGAAGVGAMFDPKYASFVSGTYSRLATLDLLIRSRYYNLSWTVMSLLGMTGNFGDLTADVRPLWPSAGR